MNDETTPTTTTTTITSAVEEGKPSSTALCPTCRLRPRVVKGQTIRPYCQECDREYQRRRYHEKNDGVSRCPDCGDRLPHSKGKCLVANHRWEIDQGRARINADIPGYGDLLPDDVCARARRHWPGVRLPPPSQVFVGINPHLDDRLIREGQDKNIALCQTLAVLPPFEQREYYDLYRVDPADAQRWARLEPWKRLIRKGDKDDELIWKFFTMFRLRVDAAAREPSRPWTLSSQGADLQQLFGILDRVSPTGLTRLCSVMMLYAVALQHGRPLGDVVRPPWEVSSQTIANGKKD